jgi:hypothetical protein
MTSSDTAVRYIQRHYQPDDWLGVVLIKRGVDGNKAHIKQEFATARQISEPKYQAHLRAANAGGSDIYLTVNTLHEGARFRTKAHVDQVRHLFVDIDERGPEVVRAILKSDMPRPSTIIESSKDRFQLLWRVTGFNKDQAEEAVRSIAHRFGADEAVWDSARVLRVPGFRNTKREGTWFTKIVSSDRPSRVLSPRDFPAFPPPGPSTTRERTAKPTAVTHGGSRSERDWAEVMQALEKGESPAAIRERLEASRQDKPNPQYYAQRTVDRAVQVQQRKGDKRTMSYERQNLKPPSELQPDQVRAESKALHDRFETLKSEYKTASPEQKAELRQEMQPIVDRERELRNANAGSVKPEMTQDRVPAQDIGYSR